jgi:tol-pal system-associated acyl-CoA thioesterase
MKHTITQKVYLEDTDAGGIMYHASHIRFMERARTEFIGTLGTSIERLHQQGLFFVVTHIDIHYKAPSLLGDILTINSEVVEARRASMTMRQEVMNGDKLVASAMVTIAMKDHHRLVRIPQDILKRLG